MTTAERAAFYAAACGEADHPICGWCLQPVLPHETWERAHEGVPHTWGGTDEAVWHARCNRIHGAQVVTKAYAKGKRQHNKHRDIYRSRNPFRRKELPMKRTLDGRVVDRVTGEPWGSRKDE
jgi:hypothetical protein